MDTNELHKRVYISNAARKSTASSIFKSKKVSKIIWRASFLLTLMTYLSFPSPMLWSSSNFWKVGGERIFYHVCSWMTHHRKESLSCHWWLSSFSPGTTKKIKSKRVEEPADDMSDVDDNTTWFHVGIVVFKVLGKVEHKGKVTGYNPVTKLYQIVYDDDDTENIITMR